MFSRLFKKKNSNNSGSGVSVHATFLLLATSNTSVRIGKLSFSGVYKYGSSGNRDAEYINDKIIEILSDSSLKGLLVDLSDLDYKWGNRILMPLSRLYAAQIPCTIIFSEKCKGLIGDFDNIFFNQEQKAIEHLKYLLSK